MYSWTTPELLPEEAAGGTVSVPVASLSPGESLRSKGIDREHVLALAGLDTPLPPVLVRRTDLRVIDGMHRLLATTLRGREFIDVEFFDGAPEDAYLRAVEANVAHGLPLSLEDRRAAALRIMATHPRMSDRAVASSAGLSAKAVAGLRQRSTDAGQQLNTRIGRDGRIRPLNCAEGRQRAAELMTADPTASLREIARRAGISPATASDVRRRLRAGRSPVPEPRGTQPPVKALAPPEAVPAAPDKRGTALPREAGRPAGPPPTQVVQHSNLLLEKLLRDPSLRLKENGRQLLRFLQQNDDAEWSRLGAAVPPHCVQAVRTLAEQYAHNWMVLAQSLGDDNAADQGTAEPDTTMVVG